jgi:hypothetical protein
MSCESAQRAAATRFGAEIALAIGPGPHEARDVLLQVLDLAQSSAAQRVIPGESDKTAAGKLLRLQAQADDAAARDATIACFQAVDEMRIFRHREDAVSKDLFRDLVDPDRYLETFVMVS